jgi:hypothetical protein
MASASLMLFRKLSQVDTGLLKVESYSLQVAAQLLVGFGEGHGCILKFQQRQVAGA